MSSEPARALAVARRVGSAMVCAWFAFAALYFAATTLFAIVNFGWRQPMLDQWREYETLLGFPFPQNVLQMASGHRPIVPNLLRVTEIDWLEADQLLQLTVGALCAVLSAGLLAAAAWRERSLSAAARFGAVMLSVLGLLWLANARRLLHGSEGLHGYVPTLAALTATWFVYRAAHAGTPTPWIAAACAACVVATFSFGPGLASFGAAVAAMLLTRLPYRLLLLPAAVLAACLILYLAVLPGGGGIVEWMQLEPFALVRDFARWIASPWFSGWLQFDHVTHKFFSAGLPEEIVVATSRSVRAMVSTDTLCEILGFAGIFAFCILFVMALRRRADAIRIEILAAAAGVYALGSAVITVVGRLKYFHVHPDQIYADRYLLWPSLFWASLALLLLTQVDRMPRAAPRWIGATVLALLPVALLPSQNGSAIWGAITFRNAQQTAAALRSGVYDAVNFPTDGLGQEADLRQIALLRERRLAMFAEPSWQRLGSLWSGTLQNSSDVAVDVRWLPDVVDPTATRPAAHIEGWVKLGISAVQRDGQLILLAPDHRIAGFAEFSFIRPFSRSLLLAIPYRRGFDAYMRDYDKGETYTLAVADFQTNRAIVLATLPPATATPP